MRTINGDSLVCQVCMDEADCKLCDGCVQYNNREYKCFNCGSTASTIHLRFVEPKPVKGPVFKKHARFRTR